MGGDDQDSIIFAIRSGTVSTDKSASYTHGSAMETCLTVERTNLSSYAGRTGGIPRKNSVGNLGELPRQGPLMKERITQVKFTLGCFANEPTKNHPMKADDSVDPSSRRQGMGLPVRVAVCWICHVSTRQYPMRWRLAKMWNQSVTGQHWPWLPSRICRASLQCDRTVVG